ncbi:ACP S-malonyltransferase [Pantoea sp. At-9b]|uniref:ACP S-malonyltransferase n=1 Tax=Pantoea sp. (strain At-9b) TaxID=592316 RepID=UPI0001B3E4B7|nr:ACP S-malonyltransferase [Pantoea sp. At-9b]ADU69028.1 Acyl transferase [Pantoea sp. At-9b]
MDSRPRQPISLMFSGQGNPVIGMGADLWSINETTRQIWDCASDISGMDLRRLCLKGPMNKLVQTSCQQLAVTAINISLYALLREKLHADAVISSCGHSLGEYSALYAANAITLENLFNVIHFRAQLMHELSLENKGAMCVVKGVDYQAISAMMTRFDADLDVSCDNSPRQQVIGGHTPALTAFAQRLVGEGYAVIKPGVSGAWHSRLMAKGVSLMRDFLATVAIKRPDYAVLMNVTGTEEVELEQIKQNLSLHFTHTVKWTDTINHLLDHPAKPLLVEVSHKPYLGHMLHDFAGFTPDMTLHCRKI